MATRTELNIRCFNSSLSSKVYSEFIVELKRDILDTKQTLFITAIQSNVSFMKVLRC